MEDIMSWADNHLYVNDLFLYGRGLDPTKPTSLRSRKDSGADAVRNMLRDRPRCPVPGNWLLPWRPIKHGVATGEEARLDQQAACAHPTAVHAVPINQLIYIISQLNAFPGRKYVKPKKSKSGKSSDDE